MSVNNHIVTTLKPLQNSVSNLSDIITNLVNATQLVNAPAPVVPVVPAPIKLRDTDKILVNYRYFTYGSIKNAFANTIQNEKDPDRKKKMEIVNQQLENAKTKYEVQTILEDRNFDMGRNATGFIVRTLTDTFGGTRKRRMHRRKKHSAKRTKRT